jgi:saccharopine dehydrogenase-like NADP-dependent oxidoreductase
VIRILVLGGAGNFGARIVRALQGDPNIELVSAGRRASNVTGALEVKCVVLDVSAEDFAVQLAALRPDLIIHCVGPFQGQKYHVVAAALAAGAHYLDLADGRAFVSGFAQANDAAAKSVGRVAISGASTLPALSTAVIESLSLGMHAMESIEIAIAPGQKAARGAATLAAVFSYLGRAFPVWREGRWQQGWGWMDLKRIRFDIGSRWGALCDVPDLELLPVRYPSLRSVSFHAALELSFQHLVLWKLAALRRMGVPLPVERWASVMDRMAALFDPFAGEWGGMRVSVSGVNNAGARVRRTWHLKAPALHGPEIPCLAATVVARRLAHGHGFSPGAFACTGFVTLAEFDREFARWGITTRAEETAE